MTERSQTTNPAAMWQEEDGSVIGYMCRIDWECEIGASMRGTRIYPSLEDLRRERSCVADCGIVEVEVRIKRLVEKGTVA